MALFLYNHKLVTFKKQGDKKKAARLGKQSLLFSLVGVGILALAASLVSPALGIIAAISFGFGLGTGIAALHENKNEGSAIGGIVISSVFLVITLLALLIAALGSFIPTISFG